jgi:hypothetical protein
MTTRVEQITAAVFSLLNAPTALASGNVWRSKLRPVPQADNLAIVVRQGSDNRLGETTINRSLRQLTVTTEVYARGDVPDQLADAVVEDIVERLLADRSLGGLCDDIQPGNRVPEWAARDTDLVVVDLDFIIDYEIVNETL